MCLRCRNAFRSFCRSRLKVKKLLLSLPPWEFCLELYETNRRTTANVEKPLDDPSIIKNDLKKSSRAFLFLLLLSGYAGLTSVQVDAVVNDKVLHTVTFFILTVVFYWILDTTRRRTLNFTLIVCTGILGVGSEFLQAFLPNGRTFDFYDIVANLVGSLGGVALCSWYHLRMLERKRLAKTYHVVPGDDEQDLELGEGSGPQESGVTRTGGTAGRTLEQEVDNWDENAEDAWEEDEHANGTDSAKGEGLKTHSASSTGDVEGEIKKKRAD
ncbi:hypothetical protein ACMFMG_003937 [Clarireedia jacksonii]